MTLVKARPLFRPGDAYQIARYTCEMATTRLPAGFAAGGPTGAGPQFFGTSKCGFDVQDSNVKQCLRGISASASDAVRYAHVLRCLHRLDKPVLPRSRDLWGYRCTFIKGPAEQLAVVSAKAFRSAADNFKMNH